MSAQEENDLMDILKIVNIVKMYGWYVLRKTIGTLYVVISATIGIILSFLLLVINVLNSPILDLIVFIVPSIGVAAILLFASQTFSTLKIYPLQIRKIRHTRITYSHIWLLMLLIIFIVALSTKFLNFPIILLALTIHFAIAIGNMGNYFASRCTEKYPGKIEKEYLYPSIIGFITGPFIPLYPNFAWLIVTLVNLVGSYLFGIFLIVSSSKLLSEI